MQESDIKLIERELGIQLPESYKQAVVPFPLKALTGNTEYELWDDAAKLVELNKKLRTGSRWQKAWPLHLFAVGYPHGEEMIAIDTRSPDGPTWFFDHGMIDSRESYQSHTKFADWVEQYFRDLRSDFEGDGFDPDGDPEEFKRKRAKHASFDLVSLLVLAIVAAFFLKGILWVKKWLHHQ